MACHRRPGRRLLALASVAAALLALPAAAATDRGRAQPFPDLILVNQDGESLRLHSDLLEGKVLVVNSFFTSCPTVCPKVTRRLKSVQNWLGSRLGRDVFMVSISVDPETDTPERLKAYAERFRAREGWQFVTGTTQSDWSITRFVLTSVTVLEIAFILVINRIWRWAWRNAPQLNVWIFPDLNGTWRGTLSSTWIDPDTKLPIDPIEATIAIKQDWRRVDVRLQTEEADSRSTRFWLEADRPFQRYRIWYGYDHEPHQAARPRNQPHDGFAYLEVEWEDEPEVLRGSYYTSRKTSGDMEFRRVS